MDNQKVIVRCDGSGVFYGEIKERNGQEAVLSNVRCLWYWDGAASLMQLSQDGVSKPATCRFTCYVPELTVMDAIEILPCTETAIKSIEGVPKWRA